MISFANSFPARQACLVTLLACAVLTLAGCSRREPTASTVASRPSATSVALVYEPLAIGAPAADFERPLVTHLQIADLDRDGLLDIVYCEARLNSVRWIRQAPRGVFTEHLLADRIPAPAHVSVADVNGTGRLDVLVASMGQITPNNDLIGSIVILENRGAGRFEKRVIAERIARVSDVRAANFSGHTDGRLDLVAGQFGYAQGETRWLKNLGDWQFESRIVNSQSGTIHTPVADFDGDGKMDFAALISQEWEEIHWFPQGSTPAFKDTLIWGSTNEDYGSSGLEVADVNRDGRPDLIYTNGDGFDYAERGTRSWHGMQWIENRGNGDFAFHRVGALPGAYSPRAADLNGDGFTDLLAVSGFAEWSDPNAVSMMAWLNDGRQNFTPVVLARQPTQLITADVGDLDGNGVPVIVTGGYYAHPPYDRMSNITLWRKR